MYGGPPPQQRVDGGPPFAMPELPPHPHPHLADLLGQLLATDPQRRPAAQEVLLHPFFADARGISDAIARRHAEALFLSSLAGTEPYPRKRVGFMCEAAEGAKRAAPAREGMTIFNAEGEEVGVVTSGVQSPCLKKPIGMGYVASRYQKAGSELLVDVRGKMQPLIVTKMPFTPANYYRGA